MGTGVLCQFYRDNPSLKVPQAGRETRKRVDEGKRDETHEVPVG